MFLAKTVSSTLFNKVRVNTFPVVSNHVRNMASKKKTEKEFRKPTVFFIRNGKILSGSQIPKRIKTTKLLSKAEQITIIKLKPSLIHPRNSIRDIILRYRLSNWDAWRAERPDLNMPAEIPYDIDKQRSWWPPYNKYYKNQQLILFRLPWKKYAEPSYVHVTQVSDDAKSTIVRGVYTFRGITEPTERVIKGIRNNDWRVLDPELGFPTFDVWENEVRKGNRGEYFLPRPPCFDKSLSGPYEEGIKAKIDAVIATTKSKVIK